MAKYTLHQSVSETVKLTLSSGTLFMHGQEPVAFDAMSPVAVSPFNDEQVALIKQRINAYVVNNELRSGGAYLLKELEKVEYFKEGLLTHLTNITEALKPKERTRQTIDEALNAQERKIITQVKQALKGLPEKVVREMARVQLGDNEENYTLDELWLAVAIKQVTGKIVDVENLADYSCQS